MQPQALQTPADTINQWMQTFFMDMSEDLQMCIQNCVLCAQICEHLVQHCLQRGGEHANPDHVRKVQDCAEMCAISAKFMLRTSEISSSMAKLCAQVCDECAVDCERFVDDMMMKMCADMCRRCSYSCQKLGGQGDDQGLTLKSA